MEPAAEHEARPARGWAVVLGTAAAYALVGWAALMLAGPPGYAAPLYPSAGIALAAALTFGGLALPGVLLGAFVVNASLGLLRGQSDLAAQWLPLAIGVGATLQAACGAWLIRRFVGTPVVLHLLREIALAGLLGALVACAISPTIATLALWAAGTLAAGEWPANWLTWWTGDALGVLIGAPLALTLVGQPRADWRPRLRTLGLPLLVALGLVAAAMVQVARLDRERERLAFERRVDRLHAEAEERLRSPVHALQALHGAVLASGAPDARTLRLAARWWLAQPWQLRAMGYSERVAASDLEAFVARARDEGDAGFQVFERDGGRALAADGEAVVLRRIEPRHGNAAALGVNALSIPAARAAILAARDRDELAATPGFGLTQASDDETGIVVYRALYDGEPADAAARARAFRGVLFVTVGVERRLADLARNVADPNIPLRWCLIDPDPAAERRRLAGSEACPVADPKRAWDATRMLAFAGRPLDLHVQMLRGVSPAAQANEWLVSLVGLAAAALLGALLLTVTGHQRRTQLAVQAGTAELRHEIGERRQVEQALRQSEARLRSILDHTPLGVAFLDPHGEVLEANPRLCEMLGRRADELLGRGVFELTHPDDRAIALQHRRELLSEGRPAARQLRLVRPDGSALPVRIIASVLRGDDGRVSRMVAVIEDIAEHLRLEEAERAVHRAEAASRAKSEFVSRMSHELRTPLNAMIGFAQLLSLDREHPLPARQHEWAQQIQRAGWHLLELINETLDLARIESGTVKLELEPLDLAALVDSGRALLASAAAQRRVGLELLVADGLPAALADPTRLRQIVTNLLSNAIKYNREGGRVTIALRAAAGNGVEVEVADSGLGMSETQLQSLFQPYNRLGREGSGIEGTGIGLVISRRLAELMNGALLAESEPGVGSRFTLRLPAAGDAPRPSPQADTTTPVPYRDRRLLYIEDNATNVEVMRGVLLQRPQIRLEVATLGLDGLATARRRRPDLILLDMHLPDISGLELLRHLKSDDALAAIPVIVVSADATVARTQEALTLGAVRYVTKPLDVERFLQSLDEALYDIETRFDM